MAQATCVAGYSWMFNSLNQSPCDVAVMLAGVCNGGSYSISPLDPGFHYLGPSAASATDCKCNTVYYSLLAACSVCQEREFLVWSSYTTNCVTLYRQQYPERIPDDTAVPHYAYLDVVPANSFDTTAARAASGPESTAPPRATFSATGTTTFPATPTGTSIGSSTSPVSLNSATKTTNVGAIAGGVVGGVVGLALLGTLLFLLLRRRNTPSPPSSAYDPMMASHNPSSLATFPYPSNSASPGPYVPTPVTGSPPMFPSNHPSPSPTSVGGMQQPHTVTYANQIPTNYTGTSATSGGHVRSNYSGMPEL